jgi:hypothetical protein
MIKKTITITLVIILNLVILCGCIEESNNNSNNMITLDKLSLDLDDLYEEGYTKLNEIHKTIPYNASEGVFEGWLILEKYEVLLQKNLSSFIIQNLGRLDSEEKAVEFIDTLKTADLRYNYTEILSETIGEKSYLSKNTTYINENKVQLYFLAFKINNIVVALVGSYISKDVIIDYAKIIEKNINDNIS